MRRAQLRDRLERERQAPEQPSESPELVTAFLGLSEKDREVLMLVAWDGLTTQQAAASLGWTPARFSVRLHRARRRLAFRLDDPCETPFPHTSAQAAKETR